METNKEVVQMYRVKWGNGLKYILQKYIILMHLNTHNMAIRVVEFSNGGYEIRKIFAIVTTQMWLSSC